MVGIFREKRIYKGALVALLVIALFFVPAFCFASEVQSENVASEADPFTIIVDAGHGGHDSGAIGTVDYGNGPKEVYEKDIVLAISRMVVAELNERYPYLNIVETRTDDTYLTLQERSDIANQYYGNGVFISIHVNSYTQGSAEGFEVWHIPEGTMRYSHGECLSESENTQLYHESRGFAGNVLDGLEETIGPYARNRGLWERNFYVLTHTFVPSVLVEGGFLSNVREATNLSTQWYQNLITQGVLDGVEAYLAGIGYPRQ